MSIDPEIAENTDADSAIEGAAADGLTNGLIWHRGWVVGVAAGAAALLLAVDHVSARVLLALAIMASSGIVGGLWRPLREELFALLALWALASALAVWVSGGLAGPLPLLCLTPVLVGLAIGAPWRSSMGLSLTAVLFSGLVSGLHLAPHPPVEPIRTWLTLIALLIVSGAAGGALLIAHRRTEAAQEGVEDELSALQTLLGDLPELALAIGADGRTEAVFGQPLAGVDLEALHGGLIPAIASPEQSKVESAMIEALTHGSSQASFALAAAPDQRLAAAFHRTSAGGLTAILRPAPVVRVVQAAAPVAPAPDLAPRLAEAEAARRDAEVGRERAEAAAAARARFLADMSHELRTPLNAIMGFSDMMREKMFGELTPKYAEYAELIHESGGHLLDLINDVLDMSKIEAQRYTLSREVFDVRDALNGALRLVRLQADDRGVKLRAVLPPEPLMVDADKRAIKQIVLNLLSNSLKFTPKGGAVILTAQATGGVLELVVADTGVGIAADDLKRLGQPYEQAGGPEDRGRGTGLGLSLVDAFSKLHEGSLTLESRLGEGTAATVRLPVLVPAEAIPVHPPAVEVQEAPALNEPLTAEPESAELAREVLEPEPVPEPQPEPEPDVPHAAAPEPEPEPETALAAEPEAAVVEAPTPDLGPLAGRAAEHHGLKHTLMKLFGRRPPSGDEDVKVSA